MAHDECLGAVGKGACVGGSHGMTGQRHVPACARGGVLAWEGCQLRLVHALARTGLAMWGWCAGRRRQRDDGARQLRWCIAVSTCRAWPGQKCIAPLCVCARVHMCVYVCETERERGVCGRAGRFGFAPYLWEELSQRDLRQGQGRGMSAGVRRPKGRAAKSCIKSHNHRHACCASHP